MVVRLGVSKKRDDNLPHTKEADHLEFDLAERGDHNTDNNESHIAESLQVGRSDSESPGSQKGCDSVGSLKSGVSKKSSIAFERGDEDRN